MSSKFSPDTFVPNERYSGAVALSGKKGAHSPEDWLLETAGRRSDERRKETVPEDLAPDGGEPVEGQAHDGSIGVDAAQWLADPHGGPKGRAAEQSKRADDDAAEAVAESGKRVDSKELQQAKQDLEAQREKNAELANRITHLETELRVQAKEANATMASTLKEREAEFAAALRERDEALKQRETELKEQLSDRYEKRNADLSKDFDERQAELEHQLAALEMRLDVREDELREQASRREAKLENRIRELQEQLADAKLGTSEATTASKRTRRSGRGENGELEVNDVSFEQLRELGLSVTQSTRMIAYRETRGGFDSMDELDEIPGLSKEARETLKTLLRS